MPERIQRRRTKGWRMPDGAVYVGRGSKWGNPFRIGAPIPGVTPMQIKNPTRFDQLRPTPAVLSAEHAVELFRAVSEDEEFCSAARTELAGKDLVCWCYPDLPCHADVLLELANGATP